MGDDQGALERVGRSHRSGLWVGGWVIGLAAVVSVAVAGRTGPVEEAAIPAATPMASEEPAPSPPAVAVAPAATSTPTLPDGLPRVLRPFGRPSSSPRPLPTLGDDGLVGGQVYSSARPGG